MKKIISLLLALMLTFSLSTVCFAAENKKFASTETTNTIKSSEEVNSKETISSTEIYANHGTIVNSVSGSFTVPSNKGNSDVKFAWSAVPEEGDRYDSVFKLEVNNSSYYLPTDGEGTLYNLGKLGAGSHYFRITAYSNCSGNYLYSLRVVVD